MKKSVIAAVIVLLTIVSTGHTRTLYVTQESAIQDSLDVAVAYDTVLVAAGTYTENIVWPDVESIVLISESGPDVTIIDGSQTGSVVRIVNTALDPTTVIEGFTIQNGNGTDAGGGFHIEGAAAPSILNCIIKNNQASPSGGGILCRDYSSPIIDGNILENNTAYLAPASSDTSRGGAIFCFNQSEPAIQNNRIVGNQADEFGGGIAAVKECPALILNNRIIDNSAELGGGGIYYADLCLPIIRNNIIMSNHAALGGGISSGPNCLGTITDNYIVRDSASQSGGGLALSQSGLEVSRNTIADNVAAQSGGGIYLYLSYATLSDNVITRNRAARFGGGVLCSNGQPQFLNNVISDNSTDYGGGFYVTNSNLLLGGADTSQNDVYHNVADSSGNDVQIATSIGNDVSSEFNFWGRVGTTAADSQFIDNNIEGLGSIDWWPYSTMPLSVSRTVHGDTAVLYFNECVLRLTNLSYNASGDSAFTVTSWPDSLLPFSSPGRYALGKWFDISAGSGVAAFDADLELLYTQGEFDAVPDILSEASLYIVSNSGLSWDSCAFISRDTAANNVTCHVSALSQFIIVGTDQEPTDVADDILGGLPQDFQLAQNYPNPFNPVTAIEFTLPVRSHVQLTIYNVLGRSVRTVIDRELPAGGHRVVWDGKDDDGRSVATGVYLYRLTDGSYSATRKMLLIK
ncbi:MAG: NosD domain-containing protein [Candidatus Zixiibacteriota bacterium]